MNLPEDSEYTTRGESYQPEHLIKAIGHLEEAAAWHSAEMADPARQSASDAADALKNYHEGPVVADMDGDSA